MAFCSPGATDAEQRSNRLDLLVVDAEGIDETAYEQALDVRLPLHARVAASASGPRPPADAWGYVSIRPSRAGWTLLLILDDGRGYERSVARGSGGDDARVLATSTANLVAGIEQDTITADETDMVVPEVVPEPLPVQPAAPPSEPVVEEEPPTLPLPTEEAAPPEPAVTPVQEPPPVLRRESPVAARPSEAPQWSIAARGLVGWGVAPSPAAGFAGGGAALGFAAAVRRVILVGADVRLRTERSDPFTNLRTRVGVHAGYLHRRGRFEVGAVIGPTLEPWWVRASRERTTLRGPKRVHQAGLNVGAVARVRASARFDLAATTLAIGPVVECSGSSVTTDGGGAAHVQSQGDASSETHFVVGGFEVTTGVEVRLWWERTRR